LGYSDDCCDYPRCQAFEEVKREPRKLVELAKITEHQDVVLCAKFSPREPLLVTPLPLKNSEINHYVAISMPK